MGSESIVLRSGGCIANCSYCELLHSPHRVKQKNGVVPAASYESCNLLGPAKLFRRLNTRLFEFYNKDFIIRPSQWVIDGHNPSVDRKSMEWAVDNQLVEGVVFVLRPGVDFSSVLSLFEETEVTVSVKVVVMLSEAAFCFWLLQSVEFYPKVSKHFLFFKSKGSIDILEDFLPWDKGSHLTRWIVAHPFVFGVFVWPVFLLKSASDLSYGVSYGLGKKLNFTLLKGALWGVFWLMGYPIRKVYYYLDYKCRSI